MPIVPRLSRTVYDRLGDDVVGELVDWVNQMDLAAHNSLRELNELNFGRFDSKLEQRVAELRVEFVETRAKVERRLDETDDRITGLRKDMDAGLADLRKDLNAGFAQCATKLELAEVAREVDRSKAELLKWMVVMWVATLVAPFLAAALR